MFGWVRDYRRDWLRGDLMGGVVVAALVIPQALGYALIAKVPVQVGLYAVPLALVAYAAFGSSRQLVVGPVSTIAVLSGSLVASQAHSPAQAVALTTAYAAAAGLLLMAAGLLRLGWLAEFLSKPIVTGFVFGLTVLIVLGELPSLLGLSPVPGTVPDRALGIGRHIGSASLQTAAVSAVALVLLFGGQRLLPRIPWGLLVLVGGVVASRLLDLAGQGVAIVGSVSTGLPPLALPTVTASDRIEVLVGGGSLALVAVAEGMSAARLFASRGGYSVDADRELFATGASNVAAALSGGLAVAGSLSKTAAAARAGAHTQLTGLVTAAVTALALVSIGGQLAPLPRAVLSAIVVHAVWSLMDVASIRRYARIRRNDFVGAVAALVGVLVFGVLYGLLAAIVQSVAGLVYRSSRVGVDAMGKVAGEKAAWGSTARHPERKHVQGVLVLRVNGPVFWVNASLVRSAVLAQVDRYPDIRVVVLDLESSNQFDTTSADMLLDLLHRLRARDLDLELVRVFKPVRTVLQRSGFLAELGPGHEWHSISQGVREGRIVTGLKAEHPLDDEPVFGPDEERIAVEATDEQDPNGDEAKPRRKAPKKKRSAP